MAKYICQICGYIHEGKTAPDSCPQCRALSSKFKLMDNLSWADEHGVGVAEGVDAEILGELRSAFTAQSAKVGSYLAISRQADREGLPEIAIVFSRIAAEKAEHAAKYAELLGEVLTADTRENLKVSVSVHFAECESAKRVATKAKQLGLDAIHDTVHEMCKDTARHGAALKGLMDRHFRG